MNVYVYSKFSSRYSEKLNKKIIEKLKEIYQNLYVCDFIQFQEKYQELSINYLIVSGGDGMLHHIINLLRNRLCEIVIGYIPTGTANDFGRSHGIKNINKALKIIKENKVNEVPIINLNDTLALYGISVGMMSNVSINSKAKFKKIFRRLAYKIKGIKYFFCKRNDVKIVKDNQEKALKVKALLIVNTLYLGGVKVNRQLLDNELTILVINNVFDLIKIFIFGRFKRFKGCNAFNITLESDSLWSVDGEKIDVNMARITYNQNKIRLLSKNT